MPFMNLRNAYEFDPQDYDYQNAGGLHGLLRDAMQRQGLQQGNQGGAMVGSAPDPYSDSSGNPQGLFGRLLALQTNQGSSIGMGNGGASSSAAAMATPVQYRIPVRPGPFPLPPTGPQQVTEIPMPHLHLPEAWKTIWTIMQVLPRLMAGVSGSGDDRSRCINAANGTTDDWESFCRSLGSKSARGACWSKTYEPSTDKKNWCGAQFGVE